MSGISLTAPMRSNLLALQNIARQQDIVQNRLATGLKVSSAIDNPSAYYTAASLSNRAADLTALLDAMSQGVQTIKTASEAIDAGIKFLEQAKAVADQALETAVPAKEWFIEQAGENGAVVETVEELKAAVNSGKELIVVYGKIEFGFDDNITLKENQKLVGTEYFADRNNNALYRESDGSRFSQLSFSTASTTSGIVMANGSEVSDLGVNYVNTNNAAVNAGAIYLEGNGNLGRVRNIDITLATSETTAWGKVGIWSYNGAELDIEGKINISTSGRRAYGIYSYQGAKINCKSGAEINIMTSGTRSYAIQSLTQNAEVNIAEGCLVNIQTSGNDASGIYNDPSGITNIAGTVNFKIMGSAYSICNANTTARTNIAATAKIWIEQPASALIILAYDTDSLSVTAGAQISGRNADGFYNLTALQNYSNDSRYLTFAYLSGNAAFATSSQKADGPDWNRIFYEGFPAQETESTSEINSCEFNTIISQYDMLIGDASYKGINLLDGQKLKINFNEDRSSKVEVKGVKADSESLDLTTKEWNSQEDIEKSISELESAINSLRSFASAFGNYYSIVTTRQDFTENLINVLEEGADKLTLADMNEESANMLALQTSQQLAINSLSLASQAAQSVLKLF